MIVFDTHAWIWWSASSRKLPPRVRRRLDNARELGVPAISCWEVGMLEAKRRLKLDRPARSWVTQALQMPHVELLPLEPEVAVLAAQLPEFGGDPGDHMIVATAKILRAPLVTADERITASGLVEVIW